MNCGKKKISYLKEIDIVHKRLFRADMPEDDGTNELLGVVHNSNFDARNVMQFTINGSLPTKASHEILKKMKVKYVSDEQFEVVKNLFEKCPVWTRIALVYESGIKDDKLKCIIPSLAYYFSNGPWRSMYVRFGYDPRYDFQSRYYQTFDFRLRFGSGVSQIVLDRQTAMKQIQGGHHEYNEYVQDINYPYFEENKLPRSRQVIVRYCDVHMTVVQELLDNIPPPIPGAVCDERNGWLPAGFNDHIREIISNVIREIFRTKFHKTDIESSDVKISELTDEDSTSKNDTNMLFTDPLSYFEDQVDDILLSS